MRHLDHVALIKSWRHRETRKNNLKFFNVNKFHLFLIFSMNIPDLLENSTVIEIADRLGKSPGQILLRYLVELGVSVIPKSTNENRLRENIQIFDFSLNDDDKMLLEELDAGIRLCNFKNFSFFKGIETHPEFPF